MGYSNTTPILGLPQYSAEDKPSWLEDVNTAFDRIDNFAGAVPKSDTISELNDKVAELNGTVTDLSFKNLTFTYEYGIMYSSRNLIYNKQMISFFGNVRTDASNWVIHDFISSLYPTCIFAKIDGNPFNFNNRSVNMRGYFDITKTGNDIMVIKYFSQTNQTFIYSNLTGGLQPPTNRTSFYLSYYRGDL